MKKGFIGTGSSDGPSPPAVGLSKMSGDGIEVISVASNSLIEMLTTIDLNAVHETMARAMVVHDPIQLMSLHQEGMGWTLRWRHREPGIKPISSWHQGNRALGEVNAYARNLALRAGKGDPSGRERFILLEFTDEGHFCWWDGEWGKATLSVPHPLSAHERLAAIEGFLERRAGHGDGHGTGTAEMKQRKQDAMRTDIEGNGR